MARSGTGIVADPRTAPDGSSLDTAVGRGNGATSNAAALPATQIQDLDLVLDGAALASRPRNAIDVERFWDRWGLTGAAFFCWLYNRVASQIGGVCFELSTTSDSSRP